MSRQARSARRSRRRSAGTGYVVSALEAALWALHNTPTFEDGVLAAVNLGDDADTTGAIFGQLAGGPSTASRRSQAHGKRSYDLARAERVRRVLGGGRAGFFRFRVCSAASGQWP